MLLCECLDMVVGSVEGFALQNNPFGKGICLSERAAISQHNEPHLARLLQSSKAINQSIKLILRPCSQPGRLIGRHVFHVH